MAIGDSYATVADLETRLGTSDDGTYAQVLAAASREVEAFTGRQFNKETAASARRFRALDPERVPVDDFYTLTDLELEVDGVAWDVTDIDPRPWDGMVYGVVWPYSDLFAIGKSFPWSRRALIEVTARWGWASVPQGIYLATLDVAAAMARSVTGVVGAIKSETISGYSYTLADAGNSTTSDVPPEMVRAVPYRRRRFGVA